MSPARGLPTDWRKLVQGHDDHDVFQALPEGMPVIDIRRLYAMPDPRAQQSPRAAGIGEIPRRHQKMLPRREGQLFRDLLLRPRKRDARNHELLVSPELDAKVPSAGLFLAPFADVQRWVVGFGVFETMNESIGSPPDEAPAAVDAWKAPCANGAVFAVIAVSLLWGAFRPFKPPPEEPKDVTAILDDAEEITRFGKEFMQLSRERSRITNAIDEQVKALEARRAASPDPSMIDGQLRRLRKELLAEMEMTNRLLSEKNAEWDAKKRRGDARRREQIAHAAEEWQRGRWSVLAMAVAVCALSGWLFFSASVLYRRQAVAWARATLSGCSRAPVSPCLGNADRGGAHAGDPQWHQKLMFYVVQLAVCIGAILFGLSGPAPPAGAKDKRDTLVFMGLFGLAMSTIWLFFGSINWSKWNAIKGLVTGKRPAGDKAESKSDDR